MTENRFNLQSHLDLADLKTTFLKWFVCLDTLEEKGIDHLNS